MALAMQLIIVLLEHTAQLEAKFLPQLPVHPASIVHWGAASLNHVLMDFIQTPLGKATVLFVLVGSTAHHLHGWRTLQLEQVLIMLVTIHVLVGIIVLQE